MRVKGSILFVAAVTWALHGLADPKPPLSLPGLPPPPQTKVLVSNRTLKGDAWYLPQGFDGPEVTVRMSLTVDLPTGATPCIRYMSDQRLWLRDGNGRLRSDGWYFRWHQTNQLDVATADVITPGVRFVLELVRKDGGLDVSVDGRRLWRLEKDPWPFGWVGFDPRGAKIRIHEVRVTAETFTRPGRDDPARQLRKIADGVGIGKAFPLVDISSETARQSVIAADGDRLPGASDGGHPRRRADDSGDLDGGARRADDASGRIEGWRRDVDTGREPSAGRLRKHGELSEHLPSRGSVRPSPLLDLRRVHLANRAGDDDAPHHERGRRPDVEADAAARP